MRVHGPGAAFQDGPFRFVDDDRPVVVGLTGTDDDCALHVVDESMASAVSLVMDPTTKKMVFRVTRRGGDKPERVELLSRLQLENKPKVLNIDVAGHKPFEAEFSWC